MDEINVPGSILFAILIVLFIPFQIWIGLNYHRFCERPDSQGWNDTEESNV